MIEHRRRHRRLGVDMWVIEQGEGFSSWHHVSNLSKEGLFLETSHPLPEGTPLTLDLEMPNGRTLRAQAAVVHATASAREAGLGVRILELAPEDHAALSGWLDGRLDPNEPSREASVG